MNGQIAIGSEQLVDGSPFPDSWGVLDSDRLMHPVDVSAWPIKIDGSRQLFIDDYLIADLQGLRRQLHQPKKHPGNPVMTGQTPWEGSGPVLAYCLRDEATGRFRLWYRSRLTYQEGGREYKGPNMYAESSDGVHWERPELGLYPWQGATDNNIILPAGDLRGLIHEPDDERAPWKAVWEHNSPPRCPDGIDREGFYLYTSRDGIRWVQAGLIIPHGPRQKRTWEKPLPLSRLGDTGHFRWDRKLERYVSDAKGVILSASRADEKSWSGSPPLPGGDSRHRFRLQMESDDLLHWSRPRVVAFPDGEDLERGVIGFYGLLGMPYESLWIGYLRAHRLEPWKRVDVQLMTSRDGRTWSRACGRETFLPLGPEGSWEPDYSEINHEGPLLVGDELWFFYRGSILANHRHTGPDIIKGMGLATLRRDGFASLVADDVPGHVTTRPLTFAGRRLYVNAEVKPGGSLRVAALDRDGEILDEFAAERCRPVTGDGTAMPVMWEAAELGDARAQPIRLRFHLQDAHLYSFWIT